MRQDTHLRAMKWRAGGAAERPSSCLHRIELEWDELKREKGEKEKSSKGSGRDFPSPLNTSMMMKMTLRMMKLPHET